jgi:cephalosporin hydroxylase
MKRTPVPSIRGGMERDVFSPAEKAIIDAFHRLFYIRTPDVEYLGCGAQKAPSDLLLLHEVIMETQPDVVVEVGTSYGGSALWMAVHMQIVGKGRVITVDISDDVPDLNHPLITQIKGNSMDQSTFDAVQALIQPGESVAVVLDGDHTLPVVLHELKTFAGLTTVGQFLSVEDTNLNGNPVAPDWGPGPKEALDLWLGDPKTVGFEIDRALERRYLFSYSTWLRRTH